MGKRQWLNGQAATQLPAATCRRLHAQAAIESRSGAAGRLKAQAAMEYLVTYGWALLALFVVVAYLLATGAFSASSFAAQECVLQPDLPCSPFVLYTDGGITMLQFSLTNGLGFPMRVENITYTTMNLGIPGKGVKTFNPPPQITQSGEKINFMQDFAGSAQPAVNDFRTIYVEVYYYNCKGTPCSGPYATSGRISAVVQKK